MLGCAGVCGSDIRHAGICKCRCGVHCAGIRRGLCWCSLCGYGVCHTGVAFVVWVWRLSVRVVLVFWRLSSGSGMQHLSPWHLLWWRRWQHPSWWWYLSSWRHLSGWRGGMVASVVAVVSMVSSVVVSVVASVMVASVVLVESIVAASVIVASIVVMFVVLVVFLVVSSSCSGCSYHS